MKLEEDLKNLYENVLSDRVEKIERLRKRALSMFLIFLVIAVVIFIVSSLQWGFYGGLIAVIFGFFLVQIGYGGRYETFHTAFKDSIVKEIIALINPDWKYQKDAHVPVGDFQISHLFVNNPARFQGDDLVTGKMGETEFKFSEVYAEYKTRRKGQDHYHDLFKGLFIVADFNKPLKGKTLVLPDRTGVKFNQAFWGRRERIKLENPEFEKLYAVYGSDQIEPRYVLTPTIMEKLVDLRSKYNHELRFSFNDTKVYCAMKIKKEMFEPNMWRKGIPFSDVLEIYHYFGFIETLIEELNLNTRIWVKDR